MKIYYTKKPIRLRLCEIMGLKIAFTKFLDRGFAQDTAEIYNKNPLRKHKCLLRVTFFLHLQFKAVLYMVDYNNVTIEVFVLIKNSENCARKNLPYFSGKLKLHISLIKKIQN